MKHVVGLSLPLKNNVSVYPVSAKKIRALEKKITELSLRASDFEESFIRSGGSGGQNVNII